MCCGNEAKSSVCPPVIQAPGFAAVPREQSSHVCPIHSKVAVCSHIVNMLSNCQSVPGLRSSNDVDSALGPSESYRVRNVRLELEAAF
jgi:hypothetical protein